mmetsp:Transcript_133552/g.386590  ORF Transcript_133552/g.386590 Transcript_133552/m.386590 type:complete len:208 (-) Transcript_133552:1307-1930(-)
MLGKCGIREQRRRCHTGALQVDQVARHTRRAPACGEELPLHRDAVHARARRGLLEPVADGAADALWRPEMLDPHLWPEQDRWHVHPLLRRESSSAAGGGQRGRPIEGGVRFEDSELLWSYYHLVQSECRVLRDNGLPGELVEFLVEPWGELVPLQLRRVWVFDRVANSFQNRSGRGRGGGLLEKQGHHADRGVRTLDWWRHCLSVGA